LVSFLQKRLFSLRSSPRGRAEAGTQGQAQ
jgi:hypothetical protein